MSKGEKPIRAENAQRLAERFILDKYPHSNVTFQGATLKTHDTRQVYELAGYCRIDGWLNSTGRKSLCEIQVDAYSGNVAIVGYRAM